MNIKESLSADLKSAMREGDNATRDVLRLLQAAIKQVEVDGGKALDDEGTLAVLQKQAKQRRESIAEYEKGGRAELSQQEQSELAIIERYLPQMMGTDEITALVQAAIAETGVTNVQGMGKLMGKLMPLVKGKADGQLVNQIVRSLLT